MDVSDGTVTKRLQPAKTDPLLVHVRVQHHAGGLCEGRLDHAED
jgi:hypothetical protein